MTVGQALATLFPSGTVPPSGLKVPAGLRKWAVAPAMPTDVFAAAAHLIHLSGLLNYFDPDPDYTRPADPVGPAKLHFCLSMEERTKCVTEGERWSRRASVPIFVNLLWDKIVRSRREKIRASSYEMYEDALGSVPKWWKPVLMLAVTADEACVGIGSPPTKEHSDRWLVDYFHQVYLNPFRIENLLGANRFRADRQRSSFGELASSDVACVQPKNRVSQVGCTLRNLTKNVAYLGHAGSVRCHWQQPKIATHSSDDETLNVLICALPLELDSDNFQPIATALPDIKRRPNWGSFRVEQSWLRRQEELIDSVISSVQSAKNKLPEGEVINAIVFPEYSLTEEIFSVLCKSIKSIEPQLEFAICGSSTNCESEEANFVLTAFWYTDESVEVGESAQNKYLLTSRRKHHRWRLDNSQIDTYDLVGLRPVAAWWEKHDIAQREIHFFQYRGSSVFTSMICEDLARSDPCHDILRSVAPNLLFAILMDGPQLKVRWPARYASTLADDPGTAVLTVTSLGLIKRSNKTMSLIQHDFIPRQTIGLWKDERGEQRELDLQEGKTVMVLRLTSSKIADQTLDGRLKGGGISWRYSNHFSV